MAKQAAKDIWDARSKIIVTAEKIAALLIIQRATEAIIGNGGGGVILDHGSYFFAAPKQQAMTQMDSFFNTASRRRLSPQNYEGIGPNYDAYLVSQARQSIMGRPFTTNLQDYASDPSKLFAGGNMKAINAYFENGNNPASYTMIAQTQYALELEKATKIAEMEQTNGFLPVKKNGKIIQPSAIVANAFNQMEDLGTKVIMNAEAANMKDLPAAQLQIAQGAAITAAARTLNYATTDAAGREAMKNKNDSLNISAGYSLAGGGNLNVNGVTYNTGLASWNGFLQIGNTCAVSGFEIDAQGVAVVINGVKRLCPYPSANSTLTAPSMNITCTKQQQCDETCSKLGKTLCPPNTYVCNIEQRKCQKK
jgi:hypothetical protein